MEHQHKGCDSWGWLRTEIIYENNKKTGLKDKDSGRRLEVFYCPVHEVETCRCGIEWGCHSKVYSILKHKNNICQD